METIEICADYLYSGDVDKPKIPRPVLVELLVKSTSSVEFSFDDVMYRQVDGVAMGSPLGPILANVFVGHHEKLLFSKVTKPMLYYRYVDDIFACFSNEAACDEFGEHLNNMHSSLQFTCEKEVNNSINFLDVCVHKEQQFVTSVHRKNTFTGQYMNWHSFCPRRRKIRLIATLVHRAIRICSPSKLKNELNNIRLLMRENAYPEKIVEHNINIALKSDLNRTCASVAETPVVVLRLPYIGNVSTRFEKQISSSVSRHYKDVTVRTVFKTTPLFNLTIKDVIPVNSRSQLVYRFSCHCGSGYIGRTSRRLKLRIKEHEPAAMFTMPAAVQSTNVSREKSAIADHLINNPDCLSNYSRQRFSVIAYARSDYHLRMLEAVYITSLQPNLCLQKQFVATLQIFRG
jgi:hypothetical protein